MKHHYTKKTLTILAACGLITSLVGCSGAGSSTSSSSSNTASVADTTAAQSKVDTAGEDYANYPLPKTLKVFAPLNSWLANAADSIDGCVAYQEIERVTGTDIEWIHPPAGSAFNEKFNLLIVSGDLPDIIVGYWPTVTGGPQKYVDDGVIVPMTDMITDGTMGNVAKLFEEYPLIEKQIRTDNGGVLFMPTIRKDDELRIWNGPQIRMDWLKNVGMEVPDTLDDLYNVLKAFKEKDANGNGDPNDEIPMTGQAFREGSQGVGQLMYSYGINYDFYMVDGVVKHGVLQPEFKEGLAYIRKLVEEGLLDKDYVFNDRNKVDGKILSDESGFLFNTQPTKLAQGFESQGSSAEIAAIPYLKGPSGLSTVFYSEAGANIASISSAITTGCKDPRGAAKWIDFIYSEQGETIHNYGVEGVSYTVDASGKKVLTDIVTKNPDYDINTASAVYTPSKVSVFPGIQRFGSWTQSTHPIGVEAVYTYLSRVDQSRILPPISLNAEEQSQSASMMAEINTLVDETIDKVILGQMPIEQVDALQKQVKDMGLEKAIALQQAALERYNAR